MSYFGGSLNLRGDPGFFGSLFGGLKKVAGIGLRFAAGGGAPGQIIRAVQRRRTPSLQPTTFARPGAGGIPIVGGGRGRTVVVDEVTGMPMPKRRRMNVGNASALRRAIRRQKGFVRLAKGALKGTGMKIVSTSSGKVSRATMDKAVAAAHHRR